MQSFFDDKILKNEAFLSRLVNITVRGALDDVVVGLPMFSLI